MLHIPSTMKFSAILSIFIAAAISKPVLPTAEETGGNDSIASKSGDNIPASGRAPVDLSQVEVGPATPGVSSD